jgi:hypothetical protein
MSALLLQFWPYVLAAAALVFGALKVRQSGVNAERAKQAADRLQTRTEADKIEDAVAGRSEDENRKRLGRWGRP